MTNKARWRRVAFIAVTGFPFLFLVVFVAYPLWQQVGGSFFAWYQLKPHGFDGVRNYVAMFDDILVPVSALHSFFFLLFTVPTEIVLGLAAAWMTLRVGRGKAVLAAVFLVPLVVPWTVASGLFYGLFNIHGVADRLSQVLFGGGYSFLWLFHPRLAFGIIVVFSIWKGAPWCYLLLMGALSACPADVLEAARIDGARGLSFWWRVVLPTIRPMLAFVIVLRFLAEAQSYDPVALLTNGGPSFPGATTLLAFYGDKVAFGYYNFGEASAIGTLLGAALVIVAFTGWRFAYPRPVGRRRSFRAPPARPRAPARAGRRATLYMPVTAGGDGPGRARKRASRPPGRFGPVEQEARWALLVAMAVLTLVPFAGEAPSWLGRNELAGTFWPGVETGLWNTLIATGATLVATLALAVPAAYLLAFKKFRLRGPCSCSCSSAWPSPASSSSSPSSRRSCACTW